MRMRHLIIAFKKYVSLILIALLYVNYTAFVEFKDDIKNYTSYEFKDTINRFLHTGRLHKNPYDLEQAVWDEDESYTLYVRGTDEKIVTHCREYQQLYWITDEIKMEMELHSDLYFTYASGEYEEKIVEHICEEIEVIQQFIIESETEDDFNNNLGLLRKEAKEFGALMDSLYEVCVIVYGDYY